MKHQSALHQPALLSDQQPIKGYGYTNHREDIQAHAKIAVWKYFDSLAEDANTPDIEDDADIKARAYIHIARENMDLPTGYVLTDNFCQYEGIFVTAYTRETREANGRRLQAKREREIAAIA